MSKIFTGPPKAFELFADNPETEEGKVRPDFRGVVTTPVNQAFGEKGKKMLFLFDYGDECYLRVELQEIGNPEPGRQYPSLEKSEGRAVPHPPGERLVFRP